MCVCVCRARQRHPPARDANLLSIPARQHCSGDWITRGATGFESSWINALHHAWCSAAHAGHELQARRASPVRGPNAILQENDNP